MNKGKDERVVTADGWVAFPEWGSFNKIDEDGTLLDVSMNHDGSMDMDRGEPNACEVTAPESQDFLDTINEYFGTNYRYERFAGR